MATIEQYQSGWVRQVVRHSVNRLREERGPLEDTPFRAHLCRHMDTLRPRRLTLEEAARLIEQSRVCAVGHRMCRAAFPKTPATVAVFLDELAEGLIAVGRAAHSDRDSAQRILKEQARYPLVVTRVEGKEAELCPTVPARCIYWNLQRRGMPVLERCGAPA